MEDENSEGLESHPSRRSKPRTTERHASCFSVEVPINSRARAAVSSASPETEPRRVVLQSRCLTLPRVRVRSRAFPGLERLAASPSWQRLSLGVSAFYFFPAYVGSVQSPALRLYGPGQTSEGEPLYG